MVSDYHKLLSFTDSRRYITAFEVKLKENQKFGKNEVLKFDTVTLNTGNAYNSNSGIFIVPVDGTYLFWANIMCADAGHYAIRLMKENQEMVRGYSGYKVTHGTATLTYMAKMKKGDHVWFQNEAHEKSSISYIHGGYYSNYGGFFMF